MARLPNACAVLGSLVCLVALACSARADPGESERIKELLQIEPGQTVADVGAGEGEWSEALAAAVGPKGRIVATEVDRDLVEALRDRMARRGLSRVEVVQGDQESTGLEPRCCDAILVRMVYHHFEQPRRMRRDLAAALVPSGRLLVCDIEPQENWRDLPGVPDRGGHGIPVARLVAEMAEDGFRVVTTRTRWNGDEDRYCVLFTADGG